MLVSPQNGTGLQVGSIYRLPCTQMGSQSFRRGPCSTFLTIYFPLIPLFLTSKTPGSAKESCGKEGPYQDRPPLCPFRLLPLLIYSGSVIAFLEIQGPKSKNIENVILLQP